ncbi:TetR/AcrR family transcriptional regulator [Parasphingopyxis sp. CP4]|uniref:TetR/AcrR family transcriptional regulator n=1 Tax=Parasphingopyxis sp. CP4 TaxID=2724527 RepID=UPI0015A2CEFC|nr:TetR/AcrR family transcriptional regulator [Parasphingopyxis sp. CP4]QLC20821.1 TetR/AcrR family transcriptional regulator [Parasphingopyxis sp. CP4]
MTDIAPTVTAPARAGRPTDERKTEAIIDAARDAFFGEGYAAASIERIAEKAAVSKVTIYKRFGDKAGLLEALVRRQAEHMTKTIGEANRDADTIEAQLVNFGVTLMSFLFDDTHFHFDTMLMIERDRHPEAAHRFFNAGPGKMRRELIAILEAADQRGDLKIDKAKTAAEDLLSLWKGFADMELRFGIAKKPTQKDIRNHVCHGVDVLLRAYRPD